MLGDARTLSSGVASGRAPSAHRTRATTRAGGGAKLHYFHGRGRAEQCRWMLAVTEEVWENASMARASEFTALKRERRLLFEQVPMLEMDGLELVQSQAIIRYLARKHNLVGSTAKEQATCDMAAEGISDMRGGLLGFPFNSPDAARQQSAGLLNRYAPVFVQLLQTGGPYVAGGASMTYADVLLAEAMTGYTEMLPELAGVFPDLDTHRTLICEAPGIKAYLGSEKRYPWPEGDVADRYVRNVQTVLRG